MKTQCENEIIKGTNLKEIDKEIINIVLAVPLPIKVIISFILVLIIFEKLKKSLKLILILTVQKVSF